MSCANSPRIAWARPRFRAPNVPLATSDKRLAIIGAGMSGARLAQQALLAGRRVRLEDLLPGSLRRARGVMEEEFARAVSQGRCLPDQAQAAWPRLEWFTDIEAAVADAEIIIDATPESLENKQEILLILDRMAPPAAHILILLENLRLRELAGVTYREGQCAGLRLHNSTAEIMCGKETTAATANAAAEFVRQLGYAVHITRE